MQDYKVNTLKKILGSVVAITLIFTFSLFGSSPVKIMPLGDSITHGANFSTVGTPEETNSSIAYRGPLWTKLVSGGYNVDFVGSQAAGNDYQAIDPSFDLDHEGHDGFHADDIELNVNGYLSTNAADIILLHIGTNDLNSSEGITSTVSEVNTTLENIDNFSTDTKVILARIINQNTPVQQTTNFNIALDTMAQQRIANGDDIIIIDMENGADINYTTDMADPLHPNATGYDKMADLWYSTLSTVLMPTVPIHLWKLDETSGPTYVDSYGGADGTCTDPDGCPVPVAGQVNGAQSFDGNDEINVTQTSTFDWATDANITIEFWMKLDPTTLAGENQVIFGRKGPLDDTNFDLWYIGVDQTNGYLAYGLGNANGSIDNLQFSNAPKGANSTVIANNTWNHIAYIITGDKIKIYINGQIEVDVPRDSPNTPHIQGTPVNIGYLNWTLSATDDHFEYTGQLDELTVYDSALSEGFIRQHYQNGLNGIGADIIAPVISLLGDNPQVILVGDAYIELNATAQDDVDGDISANIIIDASAVDTSTLGQYTVTYDVNDSSGNPAVQVTRTVNVVDATVPVITLLGANPQVILVGDAYTELNATAQDDVDGDISANIVIDASAVDTSTLGQYTVTYDVNDSSGNPAVQVTRTVNVVEDTSVDTIITNSSSGGGCSYNPDSKNFDMTFLLMIALGLFYPVRRRFIK